MASALVQLIVVSEFATCCLAQPRADSACLHSNSIVHLRDGYL